MSRSARLLVAALAALALAGTVWWLLDEPVERPSPAIADRADPSSTQRNPDTFDDRAVPATADVGTRTAGSTPSAPLIRERSVTRVEGRLVDADGRPVASGAIVFAAEGLTGRTIATGEDGAFALEGLAPAAWSLAAWKDSLASARVEVVVAPGATVRDVELRLEAAASLVVTVRDGAGNTVRGCVVAAGAGAPQPCDHAGRAHLSPIAAGALRLRVSAPAFAPRDLDVDVAPRARLRLDVTLDKGAVASGLVRDPDGRPVRGAAVRTRHYVLNGRSTLESEAVTDAKGRFELAAVAPGRVTVCAQAPGYAESTTPELRLAPGETRDNLVLTLTTGGVIAGSVVRGAGEPVEGAAVRAVRLNDRSIAATDTSVRDGTFRLDGLTDGEYTVVAETPGARALAPGVSVTGRNETQVTLLLGDERLEGTVVKAGGAPVEGALVTAFSAYAGGQAGVSGATDRDGRFSLGGLVGAPFRVEAKATGRASGEARGAQPGTPVRIVLGGAGRLEGIATDEQGRGLEDFTLTVAPASPAVGSVSSRYRVLRLLSPDGSFVVEGLPHGRYTVRAAAVARRAAGLEVEIGPSPVRVSLRLERGLLLAGKVLFKDKPVGGCEVREHRRDSTFARADASLTGATTDALGAFRLGGLERGTRGIWTQCPDGLGHWFELDLQNDVLDHVIRVVKTHHATGDDFGGIGATMSVDRQGRIVVVSVGEGGPAFLAGIAPRDEVIAVDGWPVAGHELREVIEKIRGPLGTPVTLDIRREGLPDAIRLVAERARIATN